MLLDDGAFPERSVFKQSNNIVTIGLAFGLDSPPQKQGHAIVFRVLIVPDQLPNYGETLRGWNSSSGSGQLIADFEVSFGVCDVSEFIGNDRRHILFVAYQSRGPFQ